MTALHVVDQQPRIEPLADGDRRPARCTYSKKERCPHPPTARVTIWVSRTQPGSAKRLMIPRPEWACDVHTARFAERHGLTGTASTEAVAA